MLLQKKEIIENHIKTHTERSADDVAAVSTAEYFLRTGGRIITNFSRNDKWPNIDGTFEFVWMEHCGRDGTRHSLRRGRQAR